MDNIEFASLLINRNMPYKIDVYVDKKFSKEFNYFDTDLKEAYLSIEKEYKNKKNVTLTISQFGEITTITI
jgi:hypothetical protein